MKPKFVSKKILLLIELFSNIQTCGRWQMPALLITLQIQGKDCVTSA